MIPYDISIKYMLAGYIVIFIVQAAYLTSLFLRWRKLRRDLHMLEELQKNQ